MDTCSEILSESKHRADLRRNDIIVGVFNCTLHAHDESSCEKCKELQDYFKYLQRQEYDYDCYITEIALEMNSEFNKLIYDGYKTNPKEWERDIGLAYRDYYDSVAEHLRDVALSEITYFSSIMSILNMEQEN